MAHPILTSGQWWREPGILGPGSALVFVWRGGAHVKSRKMPNRNHHRQCNNTHLQQGYEMTKHMRPACGPEPNVPLSRIWRVLTAIG
jgi:hypothetical protein